MRFDRESSEMGEGGSQSATLSIAVWRTTISNEQLHERLKKGGLLAATGGLILLLGSILLPFHLLKLFGIPIFFTALLFIAVGWLPYKKLAQLQLKPHELHYDGASLTYFRQGHTLFALPESSIEKLTYLDKGIALWLKRPLKRNITILHSPFNYTAFVQESYQHGGCDLFFPHFSERSFQEIKEFIDQLE